MTKLWKKTHRSSDQAADRILTEEAVIMPVAYDREHNLVKPWAKFAGEILEKIPLKNIIIEPH